MKSLVFENYRDRFEKLNVYLKSKEIPFEIIKFKSGEGKILIKGDLKGEDVVIFSDFSFPLTYKYLSKNRVYSRDEYYVELKRLISAIDDSKSISVVLPLIYACRQNSHNYHESKDYEMFIDDLKHMGVDNIITFESHGEDKNVKSYSLSSLITFNNYDVVVSPDKGGIDRARVYAKSLNCDLSHFEKKRDLSHLENGINPIIDYKGNDYNFEKKKVLIVDDILDSGKTIVNAIEHINIADRIDVFVAYPLFSKGIKEFKRLYKQNKLNKIYVSNLIYIDKKLLKNDFIEVIDTSKLVSEILKDVIK